MDNYTFNIKRSILIPFSGVVNALLVFRPEHFALSYTMQPNPKEEYMVVSLNIVDKSTGNEVYKLASFTITERGFPTGVILNAAVIEKWLNDNAALNLTKKTKEMALVDKQGDEYALIAAQKQVPAELTAEIAALQEEVNQLTASIEALGPQPEPNELYFNKYSDVVGYFDNRGAITSEGIAWARNIPFLGLTLGDYLV